jgi:hypothetical protein
MCGEINRKNRMGGYTGFDQFIAYFSTTKPDTVVNALIGQDELTSGMVSGFCSDAYKSGAPG